MIALLLVRAAGWQLDRLVSHPRVDALDARLRRTRLADRAVDANDPCGAVLGAQLRGGRVGGACSCRTRWPRSSGCCRAPPAVVILGDALTGHVSPLLVLVSVCTASLGVAGLAMEIRAHRRAHPAPEEPAESVSA